MPEHVRFYFDPICPWCYQTSRWARRLAELGEIQLSWGVFSLEIVNAGSEESVGKAHSRAAPALRTAIAVRDAEGDQAVGRFYAALGAAVHERGEPLEDPTTIVAALDAAELESSLLDKALRDDDTWSRVAEEHEALVARTRSFGVPTIVLDGGDGPAIFGPVISKVPGDQDAIELFRHVVWLARYDNFSELKRDRTADPDLPAFQS